MVVKLCFCCDKWPDLNAEKTPKPTHFPGGLYRMMLVTLIILFGWIHAQFKRASSQSTCGKWDSCFNRNSNQQQSFDITTSNGIVCYDPYFNTTADVRLNRDDTITTHNVTITIKYTPEGNSSKSHQVSHDFQLVEGDDYFLVCGGSDGSGFCRWDDAPIIGTYLYQEISHDLSGFTTLTFELVNATTAVGVHEIVGLVNKLFCYNTSPLPTPDPVVSGSTPTTNPTAMPTTVPSAVLTAPSPTDIPIDDTNNPTQSPTLHPTRLPSDMPSDDPTPAPTNEPSNLPTDTPTLNPTPLPTLRPTNDPAKAPTTPNPTKAPTKAPSNSPTGPPSDFPTDMLTGPPSENPTESPPDDPTSTPVTGEINTTQIATTTKDTSVVTTTTKTPPSSMPTNTAPLTTETTEKSTNTYMPSSEPTRDPLIGHPSTLPVRSVQIVPTELPTSSSTDDANSASLGYSLTIVIYVGCGVLLGIIISIGCFVIILRRKFGKQPATPENRHVMSISMQSVKSNEQQGNVKSRNNIDILEMEFKAKNRNNLNVVNETRMTVEGEADEHLQEGGVLHGEHAYVAGHVLEGGKNVVQLNRKEDDRDSDAEVSIKYDDKITDGDIDKRNRIAPSGDENGDDSVSNEYEDMYNVQNCDDQTTKGD